MRPQSIFVVVLVMSINVLAGCGGSSDPSLSGSVTYNRQPVESGFITFSPEGSGTSFGADIVDGKYKPEIVHAGKYQILVRAASDALVASSRDEAARQAAAGGATKSSNYIPETAEGNGQTVEITGGEQTLDFALTGPPRS
jgi:hypothetical protein